MTLLFVDGCQGGDVTSKYGATSSGNRTTTGPRWTGGAYYVSASLKKAITPVAEVFTCSAHWFPAGASTAFLSFAGDTGATTHLTLNLNSSGHVEVRRGTSAGTVIATGTATISIITWTSIEVHAIIDDTVGVVQVRINGSGSNDINFSGDTKNAGTSTNIDQVTWGCQDANRRVTDIALLNTSGSVNNTWAGNCRVAVLQPNGNGNYNQGVGGDGNSVDNYLLLDDQPFSASDYVVLGGTDKDTYLFADLPYGTFAVKGIQVNANLDKTSSAAKTFKRVIRAAGTDYLGSAVSPTTSFATYPEVLELNPATSAAWAPDAVDALEAGLNSASGIDPLNVAAINVEALIAAFPVENVVKVLGGGTIFVDIPNEVVVDGGGTITAHATSELGGNITVNGGGTITVGDLITDYPRPAPADPTLTAPGAGEAPIRILSEVYGTPTLVDGVPVGWGPT